MSTKNDKSEEELANIYNQLLQQYDNNFIKSLYYTHSRKELENWAQQNLNISFYYFEKIVLNYFKFEKKTRKNWNVYWYKNTLNTNTEKYGGIGFASDLLTQKAQSTNLIKSGSKTYNNREKARQTKLERYGNENYNNIEQIKTTNLERYGVEFNFSSTDENLNGRGTFKKLLCDPEYNKNFHTKAKITGEKRYGLGNSTNHKKAEQTMLEKYGKSSYAKTEEYHKLKTKKYLYNGLYFDSSWELYFWIYNIDHNIPIIQATISFEYECDGKLHQYFPDFICNNILYEIKGDQFLKNATLINPYDTNQNNIYMAKYKCMIDNGVEILTKDKLKYVFDYINQTYGKNYYKQFKYKQEK